MLAANNFLDVGVTSWLTIIQCMSVCLSVLPTQISKLLKPIPWCAECHPEGCAFYIEADVLSTGRIEHTRGGTAEMFCRDFSVPKAPCLKG